MYLEIPKFISEVNWNIFLRKEETWSIFHRKMHFWSPWKQNTFKWQKALVKNNPTEKELKAESIKWSYTNCAVVKYKVKLKLKIRHPVVWECTHCTVIVKGSLFSTPVHQPGCPKGPKQLQALVFKHIHCKLRSAELGNWRAMGTWRVGHPMRLSSGYLGSKWLNHLWATTFWSFHSLDGLEACFSHTRQFLFFELRIIAESALSFGLASFASFAWSGTKTECQRKKKDFPFF